MRRNAIAFLPVLVLTAAIAWADPVPTTLNDFFLPGSQPGQSGNLEHPSKCDNCHGGYNQAVEPAFNWRGSMMAQAARDPLFYACLAIANQDAPESGDLCIRCHSPSGWLEGRSVPTDGSALNNNDREGVQCDFCHKAVKPSPLGVNPYPDDPDYTSGTYPADQSYLSQLNPIPGTSANGMYIADSDNAKRGPFTDAAARHQMFYSPFHQDANFCGTCHDVSNPVYQREGQSDNYVPNSWDQPAPDFDPYTMFPIERTFSEWKKSDYNSPGGIYAPQFGGNRLYVSTCQDCHMRDVTGVGCNKKGAPTRNDLPLHDLTGGNTFIPDLVAALYPDEVDINTLNSGVQRAAAMLQLATTCSLFVTPDGENFSALVRIYNETGHKLPSGYPEGRRIWINVQVWDTLGAMIYESGAYNDATGELIEDPDIKVYQIKPGISESLAPVVNLPSGPSFHFVLNDSIYFDNRIPPRGFTNAAFDSIQSPPVGYSYPDGQYWDDTVYPVAGSAAYVTVTIYYQTLSDEYVEFLQTENRTNDWGNVLYDLWQSYGRSAPVAMNSETYVIRQIADNEPPTAPTNLNARAVSDSQIDLAWNASTDNIGVAGYYIYRDNVEIDMTTETAYSDTGLVQRTTYTYYVRAYDDAGNISDPSNTASATTRRRRGGGKLGGEGSETFAFQATPNPFNISTTFFYSLTASADVRLEIYDITGRKVADLDQGRQSGGHHAVYWSADALASGVYLARLSAGTENLMQKVVLLK